MPQQSDAYQMMTFVLKRNTVAFSYSPNFRDVLALIKGIALAWFPPHGSNFLYGFTEFLRSRFNDPLGDKYSILLKRFGHLPRHEACDAAFSLLEEWKATETAAQADKTESKSLPGDLNKSWILFHLHEAHEELTGLIAGMDGVPKVDEIEFEIGLCHAYNHLNTAWNSRAVNDEQIAAQTEEEFYTWRAFPSGLHMGPWL